MKKYLKVQLKRNLRRDVLRGHPWIYREAISNVKSEKAELCKVSDAKGDFLAWAIFDPNGPLALRVLTTDPRPPGWTGFENKFEFALGLRNHLPSQKTNGYRLFNGEGDRLPGLVCDVYREVAIVQFDGKGPSEFWNGEEIAQWLLKRTSCKAVYEKSRAKGEHCLRHLGGKEVEPQVEFIENGIRFVADLERGQKTGFFFDQRSNRSYLKEISAKKTVLNLFSYTGGFSIYAGMGGATKVTSVDISQGALDFADRSWALNDLDTEKHNSVCTDVSQFLSGVNEKWDMVVVDPPSMAHSEDQKEGAIKKYSEIFSRAAKKVKPGGNLFLSSCSSHIAFQDFFVIAEQALSQARKTGRILRVSGQGEDHPFPHVCKEMRYLKFLHIALD